MLNKLVLIIKQIPLPEFHFTYQTLINAQQLQQGWISQPTFSAFHVSANNLKNPCPTTLSKALATDNVDKDTWLYSYREEYNDL